MESLVIHPPNEPMSRTYTRFLSVLPISWLALSCMGPCEAAFTQSLDFNDNQIPAGWNLVFKNGPGTNAGVANGRFEVGQVDTYAELYRSVTLELGTNQLDIRYTGNIEDVYHGMGSQIHLYDSLGYTVAGMGKEGFGTYEMNFFAGYQVGTTFSRAMDESRYPDFGIYDLTLSFREQQLVYTVTKLGSTTALVNTTVAIPDFHLANIQGIGLFGLTTTGASAWIDDVSINSIPEPSAGLLASAALAAWMTGRRRRRA